MLVHATAHRGVQTPSESLRWKADSGRKPLAVPGNQACASGVPVQHSTNWASLTCTRQCNLTLVWWSGNSTRRKQMQHQFLLRPFSHFWTMSSKTNWVWLYLGYFWRFYCTPSLINEKILWQNLLFLTAWWNASLRTLRKNQHNNPEG